MEITKYYSPNYSKKVRSGRSITMIIIHYTGMQSERESLKRLTSIKSKVSAHYLIGRKGEILKLVAMVQNFSLLIEMQNLLSNGH